MNCTVALLPETLKGRHCVSSGPSHPGGESSLMKLCSRVSILAILWFLPCSLASVITIDDADGDPTNGNKIGYQPLGSWISGSIGGCDQNCSLPNTSTAYLGTYTGSIFNANNRPNKVPLNATVKFTGTSVTVRCLIGNSLANPIGSTDMTFLLDGAQAGTYHHTPAGDFSFVPTIVFTSQPLALGEHTLVIFNGDFNGPSSLVILDAVTYFNDSSDAIAQSSSGPLIHTPSATFIPSVTDLPATTDSPATTGSRVTTNNSLNVPAIVGGVVGALAVCLALGLLLFRHFRRQHRAQKQLLTADPKPYDVGANDLRPTFRASIVSPRSWAAYIRSPERTVVPSRANTVSTRQLYISNQLHRVQKQLAELEETATVIRTQSWASQRTLVSPSAFRQGEAPIPPLPLVNVTAEQQRDVEPPGNMDSNGVSDDLERARRHIELLDARIHELELQRSSSWAMGLSDDPPPGYDDEV